MKFKLKQEKLQELLEKLIVKNTYPLSVITSSKDEDTGEPVLISIQRESAGRAIRYLKANKSFFNELEVSDDDEVVEIDVNLFLDIVKQILPGTELIVNVGLKRIDILGEYNEYDKDGKVVSSRKINPSLTLSEPSTDVQKKLPFTFEDGFPVLGGKNVKLKNYLQINLEDMKDIVSFAGIIKTDFYNIEYNDKKLTVRVGDIYSPDLSNSVVYTPRFEVKKGDTFKITMSYCIPEIMHTFRYSPVHLMLSTDAPVWFFETTDDITLGIMIPPFVLDISEE